MHEDGILMLICVGTLDERTSPPIFGSILKYAQEAPQVAIFDLSRVEGIKTAFITGILEVTKYLQNNGGATIVVPGKMSDILEITGVKQAVHISGNIDEARAYARERFPQVITFARDKQQKKDISKIVESQSIDTKTWSCFDDEEKKELNIEKILKYAIEMRASDVHISVGKPITLRVE